MKCINLLIFSENNEENIIENVENVENDENLSKEEILNDKESENESVCVIIGEKKKFVPSVCSKHFVFPERPKNEKKIINIKSNLNLERDYCGCKTGCKNKNCNCLRRGVECNEKCNCKRILKCENNIELRKKFKENNNSKPKKCQCNKFSCDKGKCSCYKSNKGCNEYCNCSCKFKF